MKKEKAKKGKQTQALNIIRLILEGIVIVSVVLLFSARVVNLIRFRLPTGVQEKIYIPLGGIEQFINIRGKSVDNPVIIWLHGGPGSPDTFLTTTFQQELEENYTFIRWDQRGCGRTYYKDKTAPVSWNMLFSDLDELVDYAITRFNQPVIIAGHSWGSILGSTYAAIHPDKIAGYIGIGQSINFRESERLATQKAIELANAAGNESDAVKIEELYQSYISTGASGEKPGANAFVQFIQLRKLTASYLSPNDKNPTFTVLTSPDFGWKDLLWQFEVMTNVERFLESQQSLYAAMSIYSVLYAFEVPVMFLQGEYDYVCSTALVADYQRQVSAPRTEIFIMPEVGHNAMVDDPVLFAETLRKALELIL
jgi:Predicted hydrolases or acyltransferases (alpha/beta hydrolase superfamily)